MLMRGTGSISGSSFRGDWSGCNVGLKGGGRCVTGRRRGVRRPPL